MQILAHVRRFVPGPIRRGARLLVLVPLLLSCRAVPVVAPDVSDPGPRHEVAEREGTFAVFGDPQQWPGLEWVMRGGPKIRGAVREGMKASHPDFILLAGDIVGAGWVESFWKQFGREFEGMPIYPALGNHDLFGPNGRALSLFFETFPVVERRRWYEVRHSGVAFLMIDSNYGEMTAAEWEAQREWLGGRLREAESDDLVRAVAIVSHFPPMSVSWGSGNARIKREVYDVAAAFPKFRLYFCGHHHVYEHVRDGGRHCFVTGGGGAPQFFSPWGRLPEGAVLVHARKVHHFLLCRVRGDGVTVEMHALGGKGAWTVEESVDVPFAAR